MDVQRHRKQRLRELIDHSCGSVIAAFASQISRSDSYASRMLYPPDKPGQKPIADKMMLVIERAFELDRAWLDLPMGSKLPPMEGKSLHQASVHEPGPSPSIPLAQEVKWPFNLVTYRRLMDLKKALGAKSGPAAIVDIDKTLEIAVLKWEREVIQEKSRKAG
jgi:hypothetical protein